MRTSTYKDLLLRSHAPFLLFGLASLAAAVSGCWIADASGVPATVWVRNLGAWIVGASMAFTLARFSSTRLHPLYLVVALVAVSATLLSGDLSGVHRWITLGPIRLNAAEMVLPMAVVVLGCSNMSRPYGLVVSAVLATGLAAQPDASQAVAFAGGLIAILLAVDGPVVHRVSVGVGPVAGAVVALMRADPLAPVPEVEGIFGLAMTVSPVAVGVAVATLACAVATPLLAGYPRRMPLFASAVGLFAYLALSALAPLFGVFPVPFVGMAASPIIGAWAGIGLLTSTACRATTSQQ
jgi:cell division protein FtsW (lipid II flippase)